MPVELDHTSLEGVAPEIWTMMLGLDLEPFSGSATGRIDAERTITGLVTIVGDWSGAVTVETSTTAARRFAAEMFATTADEVSDEEVHDAIAELTNMCGGSIKNLMPGVNMLGIPTVTEGTGYTVRVPRTMAVRGLLYRCGDDGVVITLFESV